MGQIKHKMGSIGGGVDISHKSKMSGKAKDLMSFPGGMPGPGNYGQMDNKVVGKGMAQYLAGESVGMKKYGQHKGPEKALVGKQENLPEGLKAKIEAAPGMYGKKKKGMKQMGEMEEAPMSTGPAKADSGSRPKPKPTKKRLSLRKKMDLMAAEKMAAERKKNKLSKTEARKTLKSKPSKGQKPVEDKKTGSQGPGKMTKGEKQADRAKKKKERKTKRAEKRIERNESKQDRIKRNTQSSSDPEVRASGKARIERAKKRVKKNRTVAKDYVSNKDLKKSVDSRVEQQKSDQEVSKLNKGKKSESKPGGENDPGGKIITQNGVKGQMINDRFVPL